jgi:predicted RecB family endonuclease
MTNERWLRWTIQHYFRTQGYKVNMKGVRVGNSIIDGEAENDSEKIAIEIKSGHDDVIRGIGQLSEALACGYKTAALVTSVQRAKRIKPAVFKNGLVLLGVDSRANVHTIYPRC